jgi:hypothetical protein
MGDSNMANDAWTIKVLDTVTIGNSQGDTGGGGNGGGGDGGDGGGGD